MNFVDIQNTWRSPHNRPDAATLEKEKMHFIAELRRRRRGALLFLVMTFIPLVVLTTKLVVHMVSPDPALKAMDVSREWAVIPFFVLPWVAWLVLLGQFVRGGARRPAAHGAISESVAALLDENRRQRTFHKVVGTLLVASALILPLVVYQLRGVGKMGDEVTIPAFVIYPAYVVAVLVWAVWYDRRKLQPRARQLAALLKSYHDAGS